VTTATRERLFGVEHAFDHPVVLPLVAGIVGVLAVAPLVLLLLQALGKVGGPLRVELWTRYVSWLILAALMLGPILLGAAWTNAAVLVLGLLCYREFARATGLFREKVISLLVVLGICAVTFAALDNWYAFFQGLAPLTVGVIAAVAVVADRPRGYIQRVALGAFGFLLFGACLGCLGFLTNDRGYRPMLILILLAVELNDVFAFLVGKTLGRHKLAPNTSPNKTVAGALGALGLTTLLVVALGYFVFAGTPMAHPAHRVAFGLIISIIGQLGDLMLSSIKRDIGIKDMGVTIPGHGGVLDRFNSLLLVAPAAFYYLRLVNEVCAGEPPRILTGG
jgi:phosphatidate cytidylyltransferase